MLKLHKCLRFTRNLPLGASHRFRSGGECPKECPPSFECRQPPKSDCDETYEFFKEARKPFNFRKKCHKDFRVYRNIFFFLCLPTIICVYINTFYSNPPERKRPRFVEFSYLRIRRKPFPWDPTRTLFHNPRYNALPTGYELELSEDDEYDPFDPESK